MGRGEVSEGEFGGRRMGCVRGPEGHCWGGQIGHMFPPVLGNWFYFAFVTVVSQFRSVTMEHFHDL
jgi:hypothetical protein